MRRGGAGSRPPRPTTCGPSTGGLPTRTAAPVAVVTDSSADLADSVLDRHHIAMVPLQVVFGDETFRDRVELKPEEFYRRLRAARDLPTTSQPTPADFVRVLRDARSEADEVVGVLLSSSLSGTYASAQAAVRAAGISGARLVDSRSASLGVGMLALRGAELAEAGWPGADIAEELERVRGQSGMLLTVDRYDNLLRSGRVSRGKAWIAGMLDVKPILSLDPEGRVVPVDRVRGREQLVPRVLALLERRLTPRPRSGAVRGGAHRGAGDRRAGADGAGRGISPAGLLRDPGDRRAGHPRGRRRLGDLLPGRGRHPRPARAGAGGDRRTRTTCREEAAGDATDSGGAPPGPGRHCRT